MNGQTHGGKGSKQRPTNQAKYAANWEAIFGNKLRGLRESDNVEVLQPSEMQAVPEQTRSASEET